MKQRKYKYLVCSKIDNGVWFTSNDKTECVEWLDTSYFKANTPSNKFYIRKVRIS